MGKRITLFYSFEFKAQYSFKDPGTLPKQFLEDDLRQTFNIEQIIFSFQKTKSLKNRVLYKCSIALDNDHLLFMYIYFIPPY